MAFRSNAELEGRRIGDKIQLTSPVRVLKGEFSAGSILRITGEADNRGEIPCVDEESGETVNVHPALSSWRPYSG